MVWKVFSKNNYAVQSVLALLLAFPGSVNCASLAAPSMTVTDRLLARALTIHLPSPLYKINQVKSQFGHYDVKVELAGAAQVSSLSREVRVSLPVLISMEAKLSSLPMSQADGSPLSCKTKFATTAQFTVLPDFVSDKVTTQTQLNLPVPQAMANCGFMQIPLQSMLQAFIDSNQLQWESQFNTAIEKQLNPAAKPGAATSRL